jgi:NAD(P)H-hydrate repair Nnr-like enzyme with NAD(P)H-hydrate dehydratase domain
MDRDYWLKQEPTTPLFPNIEWQKPEQRALAGKLLIVGGNAHGFAAVAQAYQDAVKAGAGEVRVVLPDALKKAIDPLALDCVYVPTNQSGGLTKDALPALKGAAAWADALLFIGDAGRNSETAILYEQLLQAFPNKLAIITRDALELVKGQWTELLQRENVIFIATFAQLQKLFQAVYYPRALLFSMQLMNVVESLHKFTVTYPASVVVFHQNQLVVAKAGEVSSTPWENPMLIWRGSVAARATVYAMQQKSQLFQALTTSLVQK